MKKIYVVLIATVAGLLFLHACTKDDPGTSVSSSYDFKIPDKFPVPVIPSFNPLTVEGIRLGRSLYYDPILSSNGLTCSSCHHPDKSFSTPLFVASNGDVVSVPPHINLAWNPDYNWNGSEPVLDHLCLGDFAPEFFNTNMDTLVRRLKNHPKYPNMFFGAFGIEDVGVISHDQLKQKIVYAISQFMRTLISSNSKYDRFIHFKEQLTSSEMNGYNIFITEKGDCFHCHGTILFTSNKYSNNGLDSILTGANLGRYRTTGDPGDQGKFSIPTLRNIELTAPYMHDGRFQTLEEVIDFYDSGVCQNSPNVDPIMTKPAKRYGLQLQPFEKQDLINFLKTLTDTSFTNNPDFAKPF